MRASQSATSRPRWHSRPSAGLRLFTARVRPVVDRHVTARGHVPCTLSCRSPLFSLGRSGGGEAFDGDTVARGRAGGKTGSGSEPAGFGPRESRRLTTLQKQSGTFGSRSCRLLATQKAEEGGNSVPTWTALALSSPQSHQHHCVRPVWVQHAELAWPCEQDVGGFCPGTVFLPSKKRFVWCGQGFVVTWGSCGQDALGPGREPGQPVLSRRGRGTSVRRGVKKAFPDGPRVPWGDGRRAGEEASRGPGRG